MFWHEDIQGSNLTTDMTPEDLAELSETQAEVMRAVRRLRPNYRNVLILRGIFELSVQETAVTRGFLFSVLAMIVALPS